MKLSFGKTALGLGIILVTMFILVGCERPDPQESAVLTPTQTATPLPTAQTLPTQQPVQVYVVIAQPTGSAEQPVSADQNQIVVTVTPEVPGQITPEVVAVEPQLSEDPTPLPENYYLGWAWSDSLVEENNLTTVDLGGIILRDRPSQDGRTVGIVMGFANVVVVGDSRCGYDPVIVHAAYMLSRTTPPLEVLPPDPRPTELPPFYVTPLPRGIATTGWAYTDELTILGETAISGPLGVNLRSDPCYGATNLGFIPAGTDLIVLGLPSGNYTPVRVNNDTLQKPFDPLVVATVISDRVDIQDAVGFSNEATPTAETSPPVLASPSPTPAP
jgi:hypothetical protein